MSQKQDILSHLLRHGSITPMDALRVCKKPCMRLAARIAELVEDGYDIVNEAPTGQHGIYRINAPDQMKLFS